MASVNKAILIGHVGKNPEVRTMQSGSVVANFSLATSETYKDSEGEKQEKTEWHNIVVWNKLAEVVEKYVKKGDLLYIEGAITYRTYTDKEGTKRYVTEIKCNTMQMLGGKKQENSPQGDEDVPYAEVVQSEPMTKNSPPIKTEPKQDDLPF